MTAKSVAAILGGMVLGGGLGLMLGALIGGNLATSFELIGLRGYEATGIVGLGLGVVAGAYVGARLTR
jgi:hypothetical protein